MKKRLTKKLMGILLTLTMLISMIPVSKKAEAANIDLKIWVGGYRVTSDELNNHLKGIVSFDPATRELYFYANVATNYFGLITNMSITDSEAFLIVQEENITISGTMTYPMAAKYGLYSDYSVNINGTFNFTGMEMGIVANGSVNILGGMVNALGASSDTPSYGIFLSGFNKDDQRETQTIKIYPDVLEVVADSRCIEGNEGGAIVADYMDMTDSSGKEVMKIYEPEDAIMSPYFRTVIVPDDELSVAQKVTIAKKEGADYDLWLGKKRVTESNCNDVFGDGKAMYEPSTNTLTLSDPVLNGSYNPGNSSRFYKIYSGIDNLTIKGKYNMQSATSYGGIYAGGNLTLDGDFDIKARGYGITSGKSGSTIKVKGSSLKISCSPDSTESLTKTIGIYALDSDIYIDKGVSVDIKCTGTKYYYPLFYKELELDSNQVITTPDNYKVAKDASTGNHVIVDSSGNLTDHVHIEYEAPGESYDVYLGGTRVTSKNYKDIFGDGKASYDPANNILTLNEPNIEGKCCIEVEGEKHYYNIMSLNDITIKGSYNMEDSEAENFEYGIKSFEDLTIDGDFTFVGSLAGIASVGDMTVNSGYTVAKCLNNNNASSAAGIVVSKNLTVNNGYLTADCDYSGETNNSAGRFGLRSTGDIYFNDGDVDIFCRGDNGSVPAYGIANTGNIIMNNGDVRIESRYTGIGEVTGDKTAVYTAGKAEFNGGKAEIASNKDRALRAGSSLVINENIEQIKFSGEASYGIVLAPVITVSNNMKAITPENLSTADTGKGYTFVNVENNTPVLVSEVTLEMKYPIWVGDTLVTERNKNDILGDGGKAKYDPATNTLTLNNPVIKGNHYSAKIFTKKNLVIAGDYHMSETESDFGAFSVEGLTFKGNFTFRGRTGGINSFYRATVASGSLKAIGGSYGLWANDIVFENGLDKAELEGGTGYSAHASLKYDKTCDGIVIGSDLEITEPKNYNIKVNDNSWDIYTTNSNGYEDTAHKITVEHKVNIASLDGAGTENDPYLVKSTDDWNLLSNYVKRGYSTAGMHFELTNDINVTTTVGAGGYSFRGVFNGNGHVLNVSLAGSEAEAFVAPFSLIANVTIKSLKVTGIVIGGRHCSGLIGGVLEGPNLIEDCEVSASITTLDSYCGGMLGHDGSLATTFRNCVFSGTINSAEHAGTIWGWSDKGAKAELVNCIDMSDSSFPIGIGYIVDPTITNTYYVKSSKDVDSQRPWEGASNGKRAYKITCEGNELTLKGTVGVMYNSAIYAAAGEEVTFTVKGNNINLQADKGLISTNGSTWKLIVPNSDVILKDVNSTATPTAKPTANPTSTPNGNSTAAPTATANGNTPAGDPTATPNGNTPAGDPTATPNGNTSVGGPTATPNGNTSVGNPTPTPQAGVPVKTVTTDTDGSTITKTETTASDGSKTTETVVDKTDGSSKKTSDIVKPDGSSVHEETVIKKNGDQTIKKVETDTSGNKTVTEQQKKSSGDYTSTTAKITVKDSGNGKKAETVSKVQVESKENGNTTKEYYQADKSGKNSVCLSKVEIKEDKSKKGKKKNITVVIPKSIKVNGVTYKVTVLKSGLIKKNIKKVNVILIKATGLKKVERNALKGLSSNAVIKIKAGAAKFKKIKNLLTGSGLNKKVVIKRV